MYPILFKIPVFGLFGREYLPLHTYGLMVALGFLVGSLIVQHNAKREGEDPAMAIDLVFYILVAAILGSRILHVFVSERDLFFKNPLHLFAVWEGGLVFYGGFIGASLVSIWYFRRHKLSPLKWFDFFAPAIALGHGIGRLGCFFAGCCHGRPLLHDSWFALTFPFDPNSLAPGGVPLYPTQLMEALAEGIIFCLLYWVWRHKKFHGQVIFLYLMIYALARFIIEFYRGDAVRGMFFDTGLSTSQGIAIILFAFGAALYLYKWRRFQRENI